MTQDSPGLSGSNQTQASPGLARLYRAIAGEAKALSGLHLGELLRLLDAEAGQKATFHLMCTYLDRALVVSARVQHTSDDLFEVVRAARLYLDGHHTELGAQQQELFTRLYAQVDEMPTAGRTILTALELLIAAMDYAERGVQLGERHPGIFIAEMALQAVVQLSEHQARQLGEICPKAMQERRMEVVSAERAWQVMQARQGLALHRVRHRRDSE